MTRRRCTWLALLLLGTAAALRAQDGQPVPVTVTAVAGQDVYLDAGRSRGLQQGTRVRLFAPGSAPIEATVRAASSNSARAEVPPGLPVPPVGTRGEAAVTVTPDDNAPSTPPAHPPWSRPRETRAPDDPLLSPPFGQRPEARPTIWHGRVWTADDWRHDRTGEADTDSLFARLGSSLQVDNPFGQGGRAQFAGELDEQSFWSAAVDDRSRNSGRIERLSYAIGTEAHAPCRFEAGRFYSDALPELGLLDGAEALLQFQGGARFGGGIAALPEPFPSRSTGQDVGCHVVVDWSPGRDGMLGGAIGYQHTWHDGEADRDQFLARADLRPGAGFWLHGSVRVDYYDSRDDLKPRGPQVTDGQLNARRDGRDFGIGLSASTFRWPQLLRAEFRDLPPELVRDGHVERLGADTWWRPLADLRLSGRVDGWRDPQHSGTAGGIDADWSDALRTGTDVHAGFDVSDGSYAGGPGARLQLRRPLGACQVSLGYTWQRFDVRGLESGTESFVRQSVQAGVDGYLQAWDVSLLAERWFGDLEDAYSLSLYCQYRF